MTSTLSTTSTLSIRGAIAHASAQFELDLRIRDPFKLYPVDVAIAVLDDGDEDAIIQRITSGSLRWAFDLSGSKSKRREIRILGQSLADYQARAHERADYYQLNEVKELPKVAARIFPKAGSDQITVTRFRKRVRCSSTHVYNLIEDGVGPVPSPGDARLRLLSLPKRGPTGSSLIDRDSAMQFLISRRIKS